jgi:hypothetical protein
MQAEKVRTRRMGEVQKQIALVSNRFKDENALDSQARCLNQLAIGLASNEANREQAESLERVESLEQMGIGVLAPRLLSKKEAKEMRRELNRLRGDFISFRAILEQRLFIEAPEKYAKWQKTILPEKTDEATLETIIGFHSPGLDLPTLWKAFPARYDPKLIAWMEAVEAVAGEFREFRKGQCQDLPEEQALNLYFTSINLEKIKQLRKLLGM